MCVCERGGYSNFTQNCKANEHFQVLFLKGRSECGDRGRQPVGNRRKKRPKNWEEQLIEEGERK